MGNDSRSQVQHLDCFNSKQSVLFNQWPCHKTVKAETNPGTRKRNLEPLALTRPPSGRTWRGKLFWKSNWAQICWLLLTCITASSAPFRQRMLAAGTGTEGHVHLFLSSAHGEAAAPTESTTVPSLATVLLLWGAEDPNTKITGHGKVSMQGWLTALSA